MKHWFIIFFLSFLFLISGCSTLEKNKKGGFQKIEGPQGDISIDILDKGISEEDKYYQLGEGDTIEILLERFDLDDASNSFEFTSDYIEKFAGIVFTRYKTIIDPNGNISLPLIGTTCVSNLSTLQAEKIIKKQLSHYLVDPKLFLKVSLYSSYTVYVLGQVNNAGRHQIQRPVSLSEAIALAGGITSEGSYGKVYIARKGKTNKVNIKELWIKDNIQNDFILRRDDIVYVPYKSFSTWRTATEITSTLESLTNIYWKWK